MPKRQSDPVLQELQRVKQRIYRIQKQGLSSNAVRAYEHYLKVNKIDISKPSKLTEKQKILLHELNQTFMDYHTSTIRNIRKLEEDTATSFNKDAEKRGKDKYSEKELSIVYDALTKAHEKRGHLAINIYSLLGKDVLVDTTRNINKEITLERRYTMIEKWIEKHPGDYYIEDLTQILEKGRYPKR